MRKFAIELPEKEIVDFCLRWKIQEFSVFGSILRKDFDPKNSDIDVLYVFSPGVNWGLDIVTMKEELEEIFGRKVDFVSKKAIEKSRNPYRKKLILDSYEVIYDESA